MSSLTRDGAVEQRELAVRVQVSEASGLDLLAGRGWLLHTASWVLTDDDEQTYATTPRRPAAVMTEGTPQRVPGTSERLVLGEAARDAREPDDAFDVIGLRKHVDDHRARPRGTGLTRRACAGHGRAWPGSHET